MNQNDDGTRIIKRKFRGQAILDTLAQRLDKNCPEYKINQEACRWLRTLFPHILTEKYIKDFILQIYDKEDEELIQMYIETLMIEEREEFAKEYLKEHIKQKENDVNGN